MSRKKPDKAVSITRSSAAEYLTYVASTGDDAQSIEMRYEDENIWLTQKMMAALYDVTVAAINQHLKRVFDDGELSPDAVIKDYLITATDGKNYQTKHYNLQAIFAEVELSEVATCKDYLQVRQESPREVTAGGEPSQEASCRDFRQVRTEGHRLATRSVKAARQKISGEKIP